MGLSGLGIWWVVRGLACAWPGLWMGSVWAWLGMQWAWMSWAWAELVMVWDGHEVRCTWATNGLGWTCAALA
jgi:hypothetical protein